MAFGAVLRMRRESLAWLTNAYTCLVGHIWVGVWIVEAKLKGWALGRVCPAAVTGEELAEDGR